MIVFIPKVPCSPLVALDCWTLHLYPLLPPGVEHTSLGHGTELIRLVLYAPSSGTWGSAPTSLGS